MKATDTITKIKNLLGMELSSETKKLEVKAEEISLATLNLENGTVIEAEEFSAGKEVFIVTEEDRVAMPVGEYTLEDGRSVVVKEEGIIDSISEATEEVVEEEAEVEASTEDVKSEDLATDYPTKEEFNELKQMVEKLTTNLSEVIGAKEEEIAKLETQLSEQPAVEPVKHSPENKAKEVEFQFSGSRMETSLDRIMRKLS